MTEGRGGGRNDRGKGRRVFKKVSMSFRMSNI